MDKNVIYMGAAVLGNLIALVWLIWYNITD